MPRPISVHQKLAAWGLLELAMSTPSHVADIFVSWHPHCNSISVSIHDGGWKEDQAPHFAALFYADHVQYPESELGNLAAILEKVSAHLELLTP